jgi:hypothetical protein
MKNVVAYSLWGDAPMYWIGAVRNIEQVRNYFPEWICRFYIDNSCDEKLIKTIKGDNVEVVLVDSKDSFHGMFWRFWASEEEDTDVFLSRDCDSRFSDREVAAINQWLSSNKDFHIMRDHPYHNVPILGGMWGCRNGLMREIGLSKLIDQWGKYERKGIDQEFLAKFVYPLVKDKALEHCEFNLNFGAELTPFPVKRENFEFVGDIFDENDVRHHEHWQILKNIIR